MGIESDDEDYSRPQGSRQGDLEEGIIESDSKMPALVQDPQNQNPYAALADDSGNEAPSADTSYHNSLAMKHHVLIPLTTTVQTERPMEVPVLTLVWQVLVRVMRMISHDGPR